MKIENFESKNRSLKQELLDNDEKSEKNNHNNPNQSCLTLNSIKGSNFQHSITIKDNYISDSTSKQAYFNAIQVANSQHPKLYEQLTGKNRQKSYLYNILVLVCFNIHIVHFCFPYVAYKCGLILSFGILILCGLFSYIIQSSLLKYISSDRSNSNCNYAAIIENNFGSFCASFLEVLVFIWYGVFLIICLKTGKN